MPSKIQEPLSIDDALKGPWAIKVNDRLRVWWREDKCYDGVVTECTTMIGVDCRPTLAFRMAYDDGDDFRHVLGDFPLEKLTKMTKRPEPARHTRVTPKELAGKRTRDAAPAPAPGSPGTSKAAVATSPTKVLRRA